jgi:hypothetical protein
MLAAMIVDISSASFNNDLISDEFFIHLYKEKSGINFH